MKPPHSGRSGPPRRPGQDPKRPARGFAGDSRDGNRGSGPRGPAGPRDDRSGPGRPGGASDRPRSEGPRPDGARHGGPRPSGPHSDRPRPADARPERFRQEGSDRPQHGPTGSRPRDDRRPSAAPADDRPQGSRLTANRSMQSRRFDHTKKPQRGTSAPDSRDTPRGTVWLYGTHAVTAALANPSRRLRRLVLTEDAESALATRLPRPWPVQAERMERPRLDQLLGRDVVHQGLALLADLLPTPSLSQVLERPGPVLVLDQVTDPRNVGAILRSAAAFQAAAVITQDRNAPEETGSLAKAASGALETVPLLRAVNIARTLIALKAAGVWTVGLDANTPGLLSNESLEGRRIALVLGAEGEGLRRLTRETCDELAKLAMPGSMESLNVGAAAAIALYEITK